MIFFYVLLNKFPKKPPGLDGLFADGVLVNLGGKVKNPVLGAEVCGLVGLLSVSSSKILGGAVNIGTGAGVKKLGGFVKGVPVTPKFIGHKPSLMTS